MDENYCYLSSQQAVKRMGFFHDSELPILEPVLGVIVWAGSARHSKESERKKKPQRKDDSALFGRRNRNDPVGLTHTGYNCKALILRV